MSRDEKNYKLQLLIKKKLLIELRELLEELSMIDYWFGLNSFLIKMVITNITHCRKLGIV